MTIKESWELLRDNLPEDAGYEGDELVECAIYIQQYNHAIEIMDALVNTTTKPDWWEAL